MFVRRVASDRMRSFGPALFVAIILACTSNPIAAQQAPGSDDFSGSSLDTTTWTATAPLGGAISVSNGHALLVVPGGNNHDAFVGGNNSVRMLQSVPNSDIDVVAKFDSVVSGQYQGQGILVQQDGITYLRFEVFSIDSQRMIYASYVGNGNQHTFFNNPVSVSAPVWLRVSRSGSAWTLRYSTNGTAYIIAGSFNQNVTVSTIGPYAWNYNNNPAAAPALTASVDYFHNLSTSNPPSISSVGRTVTQISATITWTTDQQATGQVNYGLTPSYGQSVANSILSTNHSILVTGLTCGQTYDFDVSSTSPNNQTAASGNFTFTTAGCIAGGGPASDNFDERALNTSLWTFVNPFADANLAMNGTAATINIPQGRTHDAYTSGNNAVRLTQAISNVNFEVVVRFQSAVELGNQDQGIMVVQDNTHFLRFDTYSDGTNTRLFAAVIQGNNAQTFSNAIIVLPNPAAPIWLKLLRTGNSWIGSWSTDGVNFNNGTNFSASLNVSSIGPYAGTYNSSPTLSPAFTSTVDYFLNTANPLPNQDGPPPFGLITVDGNPGATLVEKTLADIEGAGMLNPVVGLESPSGGIYWYGPLSPANLNVPWKKYTIASSGNAYEDMIPIDVNQDGAVDIVASYASTGNNYFIVWFENPCGHGGNPKTDVWAIHSIGLGLGEDTIVSGDFDGDGKIDIASSSYIYFQNSPNRGVESNSMTLFEVSQHSISAPERGKSISLAQAIHPTMLSGSRTHGSPAATRA